MARKRIITPELTPDDQSGEPSVRPEQLSDYLGQPELVERLRISLEATKDRGGALDHVLLHGPPGLGKTTLGRIIANELGTTPHATSGPVLMQPKDLVGMLLKLQAGDVLFIDEIHRLPAPVEEFLYSAMEDFHVDVTIDSGLHATTESFKLQPFTLVGATTRAGSLTSALRSRFGLVHHMTLYDNDGLRAILEGVADRLKLSAAPEALAELAGKSRGTPRIAIRLLRRADDWARARGSGSVDLKAAQACLELWGIDHAGTDELDRRYLTTLAETYRGGPAGVEALAATIGEDARTLEDLVEPFLLQEGLVARTRSGRRLTDAGAHHIGWTPPDAQSLFGEDDR